MNYYEAAISVQALSEILRNIDTHPKIMNMHRRLTQAGELTTIAILLAQCGQPISMTSHQTVVAQEKQAQQQQQQQTPAETPQDVVIKRPTPAPTLPPQESLAPDTETNHQVLFGVIDLDNAQRLRIQQTESDIEIEIATSPGATAPKFRNPFEGAIITDIYEPGSPIAQQYGPSLCLRLADGQTTACFNNLGVISAETRTAFANKTPLKANMILGAIGSSANLPQYPGLLPDEDTYRGLISIIQNGQKKPIQDVLPEFKNRDTRNDPK